MTRSRFVLLSGMLIIPISLSAQAIPEVAVVGNDYAFVQLPKIVAAGRTLFALENRGKMRHELSIVLLKPGVAVEDITQGKIALSGRVAAESLIGILIGMVGVVEIR